MAAGSGISLPEAIINRIQNEVMVQAKAKVKNEAKTTKPVLAKKKVAAKKPVVKHIAGQNAAVKKKVASKAPLVARKKARIQLRKSAPVRIASAAKRATSNKRGVVARLKKQFSKAASADQIRTVKRPISPLSTKSGIGPKYFFSTEIPDRYHETYMCALPRDPFWIFAFWEFSPQTIKGIKTTLGERAYSSARWALRVSDITDIEFDGNNAWRAIDIDIPFSADNWYVKVWEPARLYLIQVGLLLQNGAFFEALRSNHIQMPRTGVSAVTDEEWTTAGSNELIRISAQSLRRSFGASERLEETDLLQNAISGGDSGLGSGSGSGAVA